MSKSVIHHSPNNSFLSCYVWGAWQKDSIFGASVIHSWKKTKRSIMKKSNLNLSSLWARSRLKSMNFCLSLPVSSVPKRLASLRYNVTTLCWASVKASGSASSSYSSHVSVMLSFHNNVRHTIRPLHPFHWHQGLSNESYRNRHIHQRILPLSDS